MAGEASKVCFREMPDARIPERTRVGACQGSVFGKT